MEGESEIEVIKFECFGQNVNLLHMFLVLDNEFMIKKTYA